MEAMVRTVVEGEERKASRACLLLSLGLGVIPLFHPVAAMDIRMTVSLRSRTWFR